MVSLKSTLKRLILYDTHNVLFLNVYIVLIFFTKQINQEKKETYEWRKEIFQNFSGFLVVFIFLDKMLTFWAPAVLKITQKNLKY